MDAETAPASRRPLTLPSGLALPNRLVKAAMAEQLAQKYQPGLKLRRTYAHWAAGGWGLILTGNVMVDADHCGGPGDVAVAADDATTVAAWTQWAQVAQRDGTPALPQLNHPGRQSPRIASRRSWFAPALAPSAVPLDFGRGLIARLARALLFGTPRAMTAAEIEKVIAHFARAARLAAEAGFKGVEIHAAHGYLLAQFLSPATNLRTDEFGGNAAARAEIVLRVVRAIRACVPASFAVGLKVNSADFQADGGLDDTLEQLQLIAAEQIDFIELSGGTYENPAMMGDEYATEKPGKAATSTQRREGFFLQSAAAIRARLPGTVLMVTGGLRSRAGIESALSGGAVDLAGLGRPSATYPDLPAAVVFNDAVPDEKARFEVQRASVPGWLLSRMAAANGGAQTLLFTKQIGELAKRAVAPAR